MERIAILGAGLTGLSAAYHLQNEYEIFEKERNVGGLCRTMGRNGFLFDYTGHLLHLRHDYTKTLIQKLLPNRYNRHSRRSYIYSQGRYVKYPFQANIHGLPPEIIKECIIGFVESVYSNSHGRQEEPLSFKDWVLHTFGSGIAKYFLFPYNQKLWKTPLEDISADWVSWSIPKPTLDEFLNGALGIQNPVFGYNPAFLYPKSGGVSQLPEAFGAYLNADCLHYYKRAVNIDTEHQTLCFKDGSTYRYKKLISTIPLKHLVSMLSDAPEDVIQAAKQLRYLSVYDVNIGVNRPNISDKHWIYFPEPEFIFYRVGFPTNFSSNVAPAGHSSMYVEVSLLPQEQIAEQQLLDSIYAGLRQCNLLRDSDEIVVCDVVRIDCGYVIHDLNRVQALKTIFSYLESHSIYSSGRYGSWEYSSMEEAILAGKQVAKNIDKLL